MIEDPVQDQNATCSSTLKDSGWISSVFTRQGYLTPLHHYLCHMWQATRHRYFIWHRYIEEILSIIYLGCRQTIIHTEGRIIFNLHQGL